MMLNKYPNLMADISGAVWEDIICEHGVPKKPWVALMEKHCTRFTIGSDLIGQFLGPAGNNWLRPEIEKFWVLSNHLSPAASQAILYENAQRVWFADWDIPSAEERVRVLASLRHLKAPPLPSSFLSGELPPSSL